LKKLIDNNTFSVNTFYALSTEIPDSVYIKKFVANNDGGIGIIGEAQTSEDVTLFLKGLQESKPDLSLIKISLNTPNDPKPSKIKNGVTFEIKTEHVDIDLYNDEITSSTENVMQNQNMQQPVTRQESRREVARRNNAMTPPPPVI